LPIQPCVNFAIFNMAGRAGHHPPHILGEQEKVLLVKQR